MNSVPVSFAISPSFLKSTGPLPLSDNGKLPRR